MDQVTLWVHFPKGGKLSVHELSVSKSHVATGPPDPGPPLYPSQLNLNLPSWLKSMAPQVA